MLPISELLLDNYNRPGRKLKAIKGIVIHWTANTNRGAHALANRNYFNTKPRIFLRDARGQLQLNAKGEPRVVFASAHYIVDDHSIIRCVPDSEVAYHVGAPWGNYTFAALKIMGMPQPHGDSPNNYLIGIEMCVNSDGDFSKTLQSTIELTQHLMNNHGLTSQQVYRHKDITKKNCPKMMVDDPKKWDAFLLAIQQVVPDTSMVPSTKPAIDPIVPAPMPAPPIVTVPPLPNSAPVQPVAPTAELPKVNFIFGLLNNALKMLRLKIIALPKE